MHQRKSKKLLIYFFLLIIISSTNNISLNNLEFQKVRNIEVLSRDNRADIGANEIRINILFNIKQDPNTLDSVSINFSSDSTPTESNLSSGTGTGNMTGTANPYPELIK